MIPEKTVDWLLEADNPSVKFLALTSLLGKSFDDRDVLEAKKSIMGNGIVPKILERQTADGYWGVPEKFYKNKYAGTVWVLLLLAEMNADPEDDRVKKACEFILNHSQDPESFGFSIDQSAKAGTGLPSGVIPCLTGNMVYSLIKLGYLNDSRVQKAIKWITDYQRTDDGVDSGPVGKVYERYETCWGRHTCHMGAAKTLKALAAIPPESRSIEINNKIEELTEYFLKHHIYKKSHNLDEIARPGWLRLGFPLMYQTDILELLGIFTELKIHDSRLNDAVEIIRAKQSADRIWKLENSFNGKMLVNIEQKGKPSKWITFKAMKVLKVF